jgi:CubicO group peptidase (beta-lactamase class C family)
MRPIPAFALALLLVSTVALPAVARAQAGCGVPTVGIDHWPVAAPEHVGLSSATLCSMTPWIAGLNDTNVHAVLVIRHGTLIFEHYFPGIDDEMGRPLGKIAFGPDTLHDERSVTKSVTALVVGIAINKGWIKSLDTPAMSLLPQYADLRTPAKDRITLRHLVTMTAGLMWNEELPYDDPANSEKRMDYAPDPFRYTLQQAVEAPPGTLWNYSEGVTEVVGAILNKVTGKPFPELVGTLLLEPLDIHKVEWAPYGRGNLSAAAGLRLRPRDLAKIGQLVLQHGTWNGKQIVPKSWIRAATSPQFTGPGGYLYGYYFWLGRSVVNGRAVEWSAAYGLGGQRIFIVPAFDLVVVTNAGYYTQGNLQASIPLAILNRYVLAAIARE